MCGEKPEPNYRGKIHYTGKEGCYATDLIGSESSMNLKDITCKRCLKSLSQQKSKDGEVE